MDSRCLLNSLGNGLKDKTITYSTHVDMAFAISVKNTSSAVNFTKTKENFALGRNYTVSRYNRSAE